MTAESRSVPHLAAGIPAERGDFLLRRRRRLVERYVPGGDTVVLDFGCGHGAQTFSLVDRASRIIGLDVNLKFLAALKSRVVELGLSGKVQPVCYSGRRFPLADASVDCAVSFAVLEHVSDEARALNELGRVLKPGGTLILSVPNRWWIFETHGADLPLLPWNRVPFVSWWPRKLHDRYARARIYEKGEIEGKIEGLGFGIERSLYLTAPMDVVRWQPLQNILRRTIFRADSTRLPFLATEVVVVARRRFLKR